MANNNILTKSDKYTSEYCCTIVKIGEIKPIEGKDRIGYTMVNGETIVIPKTFSSGTTLIYASNETQLNKDFLGANNLFESSCCELNSNFNEVEPYLNKNKELKTKLEENEKLYNKFQHYYNFLVNFDAEYLAAESDEEKDELKKKNINICKSVSKACAREYAVPNDFIIAAQSKAYMLEILIKEIKNEIEKNTDFIRSHVGFFNKTGRVRAIKLGGIRSMGYLFSLDELAKYNPKVKDINLDELVNEDFDTVDGELFVKAYVPEVKEQKVRTKSEKRNKKIEQFDRMIKSEFSFHFDTDPLPKCINLIKPTDCVSVSYKLHGCVERNTIINTLEHGDLIIGEIVDKKMKCHIKAYDTDINEIVYVPIDNFYTIPNDGEWYEIELENGKKITITGNNPIWLPELGVYRRVDELNGDEKILFSDT